jgi:hypothetical protein
MVQHRKSFNDYYAFGRIAESQFAQWLIHKEGWHILPAYEIEIPSGKGPRLSTALGELIVPDILAMKYKGKKFLIKWYESKHKTRFTWHWKSRNWQTGIDLRHYLDYIKVQERTGIEVYIAFLHRCSTPSKSDIENHSPVLCPTGLYGQTLTYLMEHEHHRDKYDRDRREYPMVYWNESNLERLATLEQIQTLPVSLWKEVHA